MSIADKLTQLATIRSNIRAKLTEKGVEASDHNFSDFATDIESIQTGITPTGSINITENGTYDVTDKAEAVVDVQGGGASLSDFLNDRLTYIKDNICDALPSLTVMTTPNTNFGSNLVFVSTPSATLGMQPNAFRVCPNLVYVNAGKPISINTNCFISSSKVKTLIISSNILTTLLNANSIRGSAIASENGFVFVPDNLVASYKSATNWSVYADQIKGFAEAPDYSSSTEYRIGDVCKFNGKFYGYCKEDLTSSTGNAPTGTDADNSYWEFVATI